MTGIKNAGYSALLIVAVFMGVFGLMFIILKNYLPTLYINDVEVIEIAASLIIVAALFQVVDGLQVVGIGILRGLTDLKAPMLIAFIAYWLIGLPVAYLLGFVFNFGVVGVWISFIVGLSLAAIFFIRRFQKFLKVTNFTEG